MAIETKINNLDNERWRVIFNSKYHGVLSRFLFDFYSVNFSFGIKIGYLSFPEDTENYLERCNKSDLSNTAKLSGRRVETQFLSRSGYPMKKTLANYLRTCALDHSAKIAIGDLNEIKILAQRATEFESLCSVILFARNINAHRSSLNSDLGYASNVLSSVLRLLEIHDLSKKNADDISELYNFCVIELADISNKLFEVADIDNSVRLRKPQSETDCKLDIDHPMSFESTSETKRTKLRDQTGYDEDIEIELPVVTVSIKKTHEQKRQKLQPVKYRIFEYFEKKQIKFNRKMCILSGNTCRDLIMLKAKNVSDLKDSLNFRFLEDSYREVIQIQIKEFGEEIFAIVKDEQ
jgi:hypothetical protein